MTNLDIVRSTYEGASAEENGRALQQHLAPDARWTEAAGFPYAGTYVGFAAIRTNVFDRLEAEWDHFRVEVEGYAEAADLVIAYGTYAGTYRATGKPMRARVAHVWTLREGRVVALEQIVDSQPVVAALS
ncbi:nuclear transport factor 2 family protein [Hymenobacter terricola]|uniref:nuclear transport factor 2 family protein n=1 Tax=Hymenobacter terricola TaxID=2819236 RepID=UPI001B305700|nr:nuclear transport factor 2 family protein [Hymenobacter terricola]